MNDVGQNGSIDVQPSARAIVAADGERWRVARRWTNRQGRLDRWWRFRKPSGDNLPGLDFLDPISEAVDDLSGIVFTIVVTIGFFIAFVLVAFVLLPLLGVMLELAILIAIVSSGVLGRVFMRRPWIIDAVNLDAPSKSRRFAVKGWLRSRRVIRELKTGLVTSGLPVMLEGATLEATPGE